MYFSSHLDLFDDAEPADDLPEDDVLVVEPVRLLRRDEELRAIRARPRVGHRKDPGLGWRSKRSVRKSRYFKIFFLSLVLATAFGAE